MSPHASPLPAPPGEGGSTEPPLLVLHLRVPRAERSYVHWILEAHEGLASLTEPSDPDGELVLTAPAEHRAEVLRILAGLAAEVPLVVHDPPVS